MINLDLPADSRVADQYPHRAGRAGRAGRQGDVISLVARDHCGLASNEHRRKGRGVSGGMGGSMGGGGREVLELWRLLTVSQARVAGPALGELVREIEEQALEAQAREKERDPECNIKESDREESDADESDDEESDDGESRGGSGPYSEREFHEELWEFYSDHCSEKLSQVGSLVEKYHGKVDPKTFFQALHEKYNKTI